MPVQTVQVQGPSGVRQIAFACVPADAVSGEVVACEVRLVPPNSNAAVTVELIDRGRLQQLPVHREDEASVYGIDTASARPAPMTLVSASLKTRRRRSPSTYRVAGPSVSAHL